MKRIGLILLTIASLVAAQMSAAAQSVTATAPKFLTGLEPGQWKIKIGKYGRSVYDSSDSKIGYARFAILSKDGQLQGYVLSVYTSSVGDFLSWGGKTIAVNQGALEKKLDRRKGLDSFGSSFTSKILKEAPVFSEK